MYTSLHNAQGLWCGHSTCAARVSALLCLQSLGMTKVSSPFSVSLCSQSLGRDRSRVSVISRSDSTLRGHYPLDVDCLAPQVIKFHIRL
jgi:uncharacterized protein YgbK (DUF1537 family)